MPDPAICHICLFSLSRSTVDGMGYRLETEFLALARSKTEFWNEKEVATIKQFHHNEDWWPPNDCDVYNGCAISYYNDIEVNRSCGTIYPDEFYTAKNQSILQLPSDGYYGSKLELRFDWKFQVGQFGTERETSPTTTVEYIFNGFRADDIILPNPPEIMIPMITIKCGDRLELMASPWPSLNDASGEFSYDFFYTTDGTTTDDGAHFEHESGNQYRHGHYFVGDMPGVYRVYYTITHVLTGFTSSVQSALSIKVDPKVTILSPNTGDKFTYSPDNPGILTLQNMQAEAVPSAFNDLIHWEMEDFNNAPSPIGDSQLLTPPSDRIGQTVTFTFQNLPSTNAFGEKRMIASLPNYNSADTVIIKVYFPRCNSAGTDSNICNNPGLEHDPNWYYYWKTTFTPGTIATNKYGGNTGDCSPGTFGYYKTYGYSSADKWFYICEDAGRKSPLIPIHNGIDCFGEMCTHENAHYNYWWTWWGSAPGFPPKYKPSDDPDGDKIPTEVEKGNDWPFFPFYLDSLSITTYPPLTDWEYVAQAAQWTWGTGSLDTQDWANPGHQY